MELQLTAHAARRMSEQGITRQDVETVISAADTVTRGETAIEYDATVSGRPLHVVVVGDADPPLVITAYEVTR